MRQMTVEVRLDRGKAAIFGSARPTRPPFGLLPGRLRANFGILLPRGCQRRRISSDRLGIRRISAYTNERILVGDMMVRYHGR